MGSAFTEKTLGIDNELNIKIEICSLISFVLDRRLDFLITNAIEWWQNKQSLGSSEADATEILPPVMKNGIQKEKKSIMDIIDVKKQMKKALNIFKKLNFTSKKRRLGAEQINLDETKFQVYC